MTTKTYEKCLDTILMEGVVYGVQLAEGTNVYDAHDVTVVAAMVLPYVPRNIVRYSLLSAAGDIIIAIDCAHDDPTYGINSGMKTIRILDAWRMDNFYYEDDQPTTLGGSIADL